ncbi:hypothetical protein ABTZ99_13740 [Actinosynnema sp. NPDC002837]
MSRPGGRADVANTGSGTVSVIDAKSGEPADPFAVGKRPEGVAVTS